MVGQTVAEQHRVNLDPGARRHRAAQRGDPRVQVAGDEGTSQVLERILTGEEEHADWLRLNWSSSANSASLSTWLSRWGPNAPAHAAFVPRGQFP